MTTTDKKGYKVLIPTAGTGSRLHELTKYINKSLVDVASKPAISRIIDMFPSECEFVIPLGYKGEIVKQFLNIAYPDRIFYFSNVEKYEGEGSGLGLTILSAEKFLNEPFVFCSCDTIVEGEIPYPDKNIAGFAIKDNKNEYRTIEVINSKVTNLFEKGEANENSLPYIGLAHIKDYQIFWEQMHNGGKNAVKIGESYALKTFIDLKTLYAKEYKWFDTGNKQELNKTIAHFKSANMPNILPKPDEAIWFVNGKVIKYSNNKSFIKERVERTKYLQGFVPTITDVSDNMYAYNEVEGTVLSKITDINLFKKLLDFSAGFWKKIPTNDNFKDVCRKFYFDKTIERINLYYKTFEQTDKITVVNGIKQPKLSQILENLDWENIINGEPGRFHGDFHFENILYNKKTDKFTFLDWRQNFGGLQNYGDIYYDLAKLLHGLIICHELIAHNKFSVEINNENIKYSFERKPILIECEKYYYDYLFKNGYDVNKVKTLTALIFLNIAPLHHFPYCHLLYYLGKTMLFNK